MREMWFRIWSSSQGKTLQTLRLPQGSKGGGGPAAQSFVTCSWPDRATILSGGTAGELISWDLTRPAKKGGGYEYDILHRVHFKNIFSLAASSRLVYSVGQDRTLTAYDLAAKQLAYSLPNLNGYVYCLAANPVEPSLLAVGVGDGLIRLWKLGSPQLFDLTYVRLNQAKVMSMAWHPTRYQFLAFAFMEKLFNSIL
jgi:WD40 repeat protein